MAHGNIALVGDAAFTARPHIGVGITKAVEDSMALAESLENNFEPSKAIELFNKQRHYRNRAWVDQSRALGAYLQAQLASDLERQHALKNRTMEAIMRDTASIK